MLGNADGETSERGSTLDRLCREYASNRERLVSTLCRKFKLRPHEAEDLADKALEKAVANIAQYNPAKPLIAWLLTIAERCAWDYVRSAERRRATVNVEDLDMRREPPSHPDPAKEYERKRLVEMVQAAVEALPKEQKDAIHLCEYDELSHEDAAAKMGVPIRRLRQWLYEGRETLGRNRELRVLYYGCDFSRKETRPRQSRNRGDDGVRG